MARGKNYKESAGNDNSTGAMCVTKSNDIQYITSDNKSKDHVAIVDTIGD